VHAEVEGGISEQEFRDLLKNALTMGINIAGLKDMKSALEIDLLPKRKPKMKLLPGRHSPCAA
jgi:hypothetical protein